MRKKNSFFIPIIVLFLLIIGLLLIPIGTIFLPQISMNYRFKKLAKEADTCPAYALLGSLYLDNSRLIQNDWLVRNGVKGTVEEVLLIDKNCIWFVYRNPVGTENGWIWNLATVDRSGDNLKILCSEEFGLDGGMIHYHRHNDYFVDFWKTKNGFYYDGKIILTDQVKLIEYNTKNGEVKKMSASQYVYPGDDMKVEIDSPYQIRVICNGQEWIITPDRLSQTSPAFNSLMALERNAMWNGESPLKELFHSIQTDGEKVYIICSVMHWAGEVYGVVFQYDLQTSDCKYIFNEYIGDSIDDDFYIVPRIY